jgi:phage-related protein
MMSALGDWSTVFYIDEHGGSPVEEFLARLDPKTQRRFRWSIEQLRARNTQARPPLARHLEGKLWELREESQTNIDRLIYFFFTGRQIVFLHGFPKKTEKTPRREIDLATQRLGLFRASEGGDNDDD